MGVRSHGNDFPAELLIAAQHVVTGVWLRKSGLVAAGVDFDAFALFYQQLQNRVHLIGMLFVNMNCMQSVNYALPATILSVMRQGVLLIPLLYILQLIAGLEGVIYGQAITDYIAVVLSTVFWRNIRKKL